MANSAIRPRSSSRAVGEEPPPRGLRGDVEQVELPGQERLLDRPALVAGLAGVEEPGPHAQVPQRVDLVLHQRDQR
jgi:hypothetical protein